MSLRTVIEIAIALTAVQLVLSGMYEIVINMIQKVAQ